MRGPMNIEFISAKQAKDTYQYERFTRINNLR